MEPYWFHKTLFTVIKMATDIENLFKTAGELYSKDGGQVYLSKNTLHGIYLAVVPQKFLPPSYIYPVYNIGDDVHVRKLHALAKTGTFKTFGCSLCTVNENDNVVAVSDTQNQLYIDQNNPSELLRVPWSSRNGTLYTISATVPQYYPHNLIFMTESHVPTYAVFTFPNLFMDVYEYLCSVNRQTVAIFNGEFGSVKEHFHLHLTDQSFVVIKKVSQHIQGLVNVQRTASKGGLFPINDIIVRGLVLYSTNLSELYEMVTAYAHNKYLLVANREKYSLTANFFCEKYSDETVYVTILHLIDKGQALKKYIHCDYFVIPSGYLMSVKCLTNDLEWVDTMTVHYSKLYLPIDTTLGPDRSSEINNLFILDQPLEIFYHKLALKIAANPEFLAEVGEYLLTHKCYNCTRDQFAKYNYLLGFFICGLANVSTFLVNPTFYQMRIDAAIANLMSFNAAAVGKKGLITSDYMFFRGTFIGLLLQYTIDNLIKVGDKAWIDWDFNRIGEKSAAGTLTVAKIKNVPTVDFVAKIIPINTPEKMAEYNHELAVNLIVNGLRAYVPNYIYCFGGFMCNGTNMEQLCGGGQHKFGYTLLENIKNSQTLFKYLFSQVHFGIPAKKLVQLEVDDLVDVIFQITTGMSFGWETKHFTHYDFHLNNVMVFDFINNPNYLELFKFYNETNKGQLPLVSNVLFKYHTGKNVYTMPAKMLFITIDYGTSYIDGRQGKYEKPRNSEFFGMTSGRPNQLSDIYTFLMSVITVVMSIKKYLFVDESGKYRSNKLTKLTNKFFESFKNLFADPPETIIQNLLARDAEQQVAYLEGNLKYYFLRTATDPEKYRGVYKYVHRDVQPGDIAGDFNSPTLVCEWLYNSFYKGQQKRFDKLEKESSTYVFNWGGPFLPAGILQGIQPTAETRKLLEQRKTKNKMLIEQVDQLTYSF